MKTSYWSKADNSGMLYPLILTLSTQSNFEFCARLSVDVDPDLLENALVKTYDRFRFAKVELQNNLFTSCLVENNKDVVVGRYDGKLLGRIDFQKNNDYLIEVSYINNEIHFRFFHGLTDGNGALVFIKYLLIEYAKNTGLTVENDNDVAKKDENENAYQKYLDKSVSKKGLIANAKSKALQVNGKFFRRDGLGYISGEIPLDDALAISRKYNCSITVLLGATVMLAVNEIYGDKKCKPSLFIPVNLRKYFKSDTLTNFVSSAKCIFPPDISDLEQTIAILKDDLAKELSEDNLKKALVLASTVANNPVTKFCPFAVKRALITLGREFVTNCTQTMILSNMGSLELPPETHSLIEGFNSFLNCNRRTPVNMAVNSYNGILSVCFTRHIIDKKIEKSFFEKMRALGLDFEIRSNYREDGYDM